jgi:hypothetical protein
VQHGLRVTSVRVVERWNDSLGILMYGSCCKLVAVVAVNGQIALRCFAELWAVEYDGCGTQRTMSGPKYTRNISVGGYMSMLAKVYGTSRDSTQKVCQPQTDS